MNYSFMEYDIIDNTVTRSFKGNSKEGAGGEHPSCSARGYGGVLKAPPSGSGA